MRKTLDKRVVVLAKHGLAHNKCQKTQKQYIDMNLIVRKPVFGSDTNRAVQPQKMARSFKFRIYEEEGLYYLCSENKGADQLRGYREADLRLCFRICKRPTFLQRGSYTCNMHV